MLHTLELLLNFDFYVCLHVIFQKSSFWVLILAAGGPFWVSISQKNGSLLGPSLKAWGYLIVLVSVLFNITCAHLGMYNVHMSTYALALVCMVVQIGFSFSENMATKIKGTCNPKHRVLKV